MLALLLASLVLSIGPKDEQLLPLQRRVAADLATNKPLVIAVHVPLCDNQVIWCGNKRLGDGDSPKTNLYWATSGGFIGWFRRAKQWTLVDTQKNRSQNILETKVWKKTVKPGRVWRALGVEKPFPVYIVAHAWRGSSITDVLHRYIDDLYGDTEEPIQLPDGTALAAGGKAHVVAYVGHNGWMDVPTFPWEKLATTASATPKGAIAIACATADYLAKPVPSANRIPLVMTTSFMFAGAHSFEGAVTAFVHGGDLATIRRGAAKNHAIGQGRKLNKVLGAFTNPSHSRWKQYSE